MKIVLANKFYYLKGGAERHLFDLKSLLERHGHETVPFAMSSGKDVETPWKRFFVSPVETGKVSFSWSGLKTAGRVLYSFEARRKFAALLDEAKPDIVHVHNIYHQISPSILPEIKKRRLPAVMTVHDYALLAPNYGLFHDGKICEITKPHRYFRAVGHRCVKGSVWASALAAAAMSLHRRLKLWSSIDLFLCPSRFVQSMLINYGWPEERTAHLPLFIDAAAWTPSYGGDYALFVGRLSPEKGADILIRAAAATKIPVRVVGAGPEEGKLKALAAELKADNVEFRGFKAGADLKDEYAGARFVVIPSMSFETFGLSALEAYASGKSVVASEIGGLAEAMKPGETGIPVSAGDVKGLAEVLSGFWSEPARCVEMGRAGRAWVETEFSPERHHQGLISFYRKLAG